MIQKILIRRLRRLTLILESKDLGLIRVNPVNPWIKDSKAFDPQITQIDADFSLEPRFKGFIICENP